VEKMGKGEGGGEEKICLCLYLSVAQIELLGSIAATVPSMGC